MTNRHRRIRVHQQKGHGFPHDVASTEYDRRNAFGGDAAAPQNLHHSQRRAGDQARLSADQSSEVYGMKAVHILLRVDSLQNAARIHLARQRQLHEYAVNVLTAIQVADQLQQFRGGNAFRRRKKPAAETELFASRDFALDIDLGGGIMADENGGAPRTDSGSSQFRNLRLQFRIDLIADGVAV